MPSGFLLGVEADLTFPNYLTSNSIVAGWPRRAPTSSTSSTTSARCVAASATRRSLARLCHRRTGLGRRRFVNSPVIGDEEKKLHVRVGWAAGAGVEYAFAPHWTVRLEYLHNHFERANIGLPSGTQYTSTLDLQRCASVSTARSTGRDLRANAEDTDDRSRIRPLGNPRPDDLPAAGLSVRSARPIPAPNSFTPAPQAQATWSNGLFLERPALGRRRSLFQSRTAAGIWPERHRGRRRLPQRRSAEIELPLSALQHLAAVPAPDLRLRRRAGRRSRATPTSSPARSTSRG